VTSVLVVNAGSSSLKLGVLDEADRVTAAVQIDRWDGDPEHGELSRFVAAQRDVVATVGHRVVHGGSEFTGPVLIDQQVLARIAALSDLAPLHQPRALAGIKAVGRLLPEVPAVACFDTAFHSALPAAAATYALPAAWNQRFSLRRYGFHGLSHAYASRRAAQLTDDRSRIITCHLGAGASLAAVLFGRCVDTTMGFTPLEGLVMATRSGSVDPGLILWLAERGGLSVTEINDGLEKRSGLAGLANLPSGSGDLRDVHAAAAAGEQAANLAIEVYLHRLCREIAAMAAAMNGLDVLVFTGGVGEHDPVIRARTAAGLAFLGVAVDADLNAAASGDNSANDSANDSADADISARAAVVRTLRITAREDVEIARQTRSVEAARSR
jgi:acetate kinase